jgi:hypothetical protein
MKTIKVLVLNNNQVLISQIEEVGSELGEPDCKLIEPYLIVSGTVGGLGATIEPWLMEYTVQNNFMISSDKILTIIEPKAMLLEKYQSATK